MLKTRTAEIASVKASDPRRRKPRAPRPKTPETCVPGVAVVKLVSIFANSTIPLKI
jgi:hypothetical protein